MLDRGLEPVAVHDDVERPVAALGALGRLLRVEGEPRLQLLAGGARVDEDVAAGAPDVRDPLVQHACIRRHDCDGARRRPEADCPRHGAPQLGGGERLDRLTEAHLVG